MDDLPSPLNAITLAGDLFTIVAGVKEATVGKQKAIVMKTNRPNPKNHDQDFQGAALCLVFSVSVGLVIRFIILCQH